MGINRRISEIPNTATTIPDTAIFPFVDAGQNYKITYANIKATIDDNFARLNGSAVVDNATAVAFVSGSFTGTIQPASLSANRVYTLPNTGGNVVLDSVGYTFTQAQNFSAVVTFAARPVLGPVGTNSGDGGGLALRELAANGSHAVIIRAADAMAADYIITLPAVQGGAGTVPTNDGAGNLSWQVAGSVFGPVGTNAGDGGRVSLQELAVNGTNVVRLKAPDSITANRDLFVPDDNGTLATQEFVIVNSIVGIFN